MIPQLAQNRIQHGSDNRQYGRSPLRRQATYGLGATPVEARQDERTPSSPAVASITHQKEIPAQKTAKEEQPTLGLIAVGLGKPALSLDSETAVESLFRVDEDAELGKPGERVDEHARMPNDIRVPLPNRAEQHVERESAKPTRPVNRRDSTTTTPIRRASTSARTGRGFPIVLKAGKTHISQVNIS